MTLPKVLKILLAIFVTLTATSMTAASAWDRGGTLVDRSLLVSLSVVIILAVHLLPAISRRPAAWLIWAGCLFCAIFGHLSFLTHASLRAGETLARQSALNVGTDNQVETVKAALAQIKARPVAEAMSQLSQTDDKRLRAVLREEITEGKKAEMLRYELIRLSQVSTSAKIDGARDPVTAKLSQVFGWSEGEISVAIGLTISMLVELVGALFWYEALRPSVTESDEKTVVTPFTAQRKTKAVTRTVTQNVTGVTTDITGDVTNSVTHVTKFNNAGVTLPMHPPNADSEVDYNAEQARLVPDLELAIQAGKCKGTVAGIRKFLRCSQSRAQELRRQIV